MKKLLNQIYPLLIIAFLTSVFTGGIFMLFGETFDSILVFGATFFIGFCTDGIIDILIDNYAEEKNRLKYKLIKTTLWVVLLSICLILTILL